MTPKSVILRVDKLLREEKKKNVPFGGCVVVFSGDFRQCLPVVLNNPSMSDVYERLSMRWIFQDFFFVIKSILSCQLNLLENNLQLEFVFP